MATAINAVLLGLGSFHTGRHSQPASGKARAQSQDKAHTVVALGIEAAAGAIKNIGPVAVPGGSPRQLANAALSCCWLALRAGVLRRAVRSWVRPLLHRGTCSVSVGRMPLRSSPWPKASSSCAVGLPARLAIAPRSATVHKCGLTGRSTGPIAACGQKPAISFWAFSHMPQRSG